MSDLFVESLLYTRPDIMECSVRYFALAFASSLFLWLITWCCNVRANNISMSLEAFNVQSGNAQRQPSI